MTRAQAIALLGAQCQAAVAPVLSSTELGALVDAAARWTVWAPATAYAYGAVVQPTVPVGHLYRVIVAGTSGQTEPAWPPYTNPDRRVGLTRPYWHNAPATYTSGLVQDGAGAGEPLTWLEAGPDGPSVYDLRLATYNAWLQKAAKAGADYDVQLDRDQYKRSQVAAFCLQMAQCYAPTGIA